MTAGPESEFPSQQEFKEKHEEIFQFLKRISETPSWDLNWKHHNLRCEHASLNPSPIAIYTFTVTSEMCNIRGTLHGGCAATLIDSLSVVLLGATSRPGSYSRLGITRSLNVTYFRSLQDGEEGRIVCNIMNAGKKMAAVRADVFGLESGKLCLSGHSDILINIDEADAKL